MGLVPVLPPRRAMTGSNVTSWAPLVPNPHPLVIQSLAETWLSGAGQFDMALQKFGLHKNRAAIVKLVNEYLEEHGPAGPIKRVTP